MFFGVFSFNNLSKHSFFIINQGLSERQIAAVEFVKENKKITSKDYQLLTGLSRETASRDLKTLVDIGVFKDSGAKGAGAFYILN